MQWSAGDPAPGSGVRHYDLAYRLDGGELTPWLTATTQTEATFEGEAGHTYTFYVRATDQVSNTGDWAEGSTKVVSALKYYSFAGQMVAMRANGVVYYLHGDHLGSTSLTTDAGGSVVAEQRYLPYGEVRWSSGTLPTDLAYTGQRGESFGLIDYKARYYSPRLGRFASADTLVPNQNVPQLLNRYSYAGNSPLVYNDPDGHCGLLCIAVIGLTMVGTTLLVASDARNPEVQYMQSLHATAATDLDALITMFRTDQLSGDTAEDRFGTIRGLTRKIPGLYTAGGWGETGLNKDFQDGRWYAEYWGGSTAQIGHFLTAVEFGRLATLYPRDEKGYINLAAGHETFGDPWIPIQFLSARSHPEVQDMFHNAIEADAAGNYDSRDDYLKQILNLIGGPLENRKGNSLEDLRLTVRGWRFGQMLANGYFASREEAAQWLSENLR